MVTSIRFLKTRLIFLGIAGFLIVSAGRLQAQERGGQQVSGERRGVIEGDGAALFQKAVEKMKSFETLDFQMFYVSINARGEAMPARPAHIFYERPDKARLELDEPPTQIRVVNDKQMLSLMVNNKGVSIRPATYDNPLMQTGGLAQRSPLFVAMLGGDEVLPQGARAVINGEKMVGEDKAAVVDVYPNGIDKDFPIDTLWIRESDGLILGEAGQNEIAGERVGREMTMKYRTMNEPIDPQVFSLEPPKDFPEPTQEQPFPYPKEMDAGKSAGKKPVNPFVGQPITEVTMTPVAGGAPVTTTELKGKPYILDVWATWCPPCRKALPYLEKVNALGAEKGLAVYCLSNESAAVVQEFLDKTPYKVNFVIDQTGKIKKDYEITGIPTTFAVDKEGVIRGIEVGFGNPKNLEDLVGTLGIEIQLVEEKTSGGSPLVIFAPAGAKEGK